MASFITDIIIFRVNPHGTPFKFHNNIKLCPALRLAQLPQPLHVLLKTQMFMLSVA